MQCPASPIAWFYPTDFETDMNGKKQEYEAVVLLPFIDTAQLIQAETAQCSVHLLTATEIARNFVGASAVYSLCDNKTHGESLLSLPRGPIFFGIGPRHRPARYFHSRFPFQGSAC